MSQKMLYSCANTFRDRYVFLNDLVFKTAFISTIVGADVTYRRAKRNIQFPLISTEFINYSM